MRPINILTPTVPTSEEAAASRTTQALRQADRTLSRFISAIREGYFEFWGRPGGLRSREDILADLAANPAGWAAAFSRHASTLAFLVTEGLIEMPEAHEITTPYAVTFPEDGSAPTLGEDLSEPWAPEPAE